MAARSRRIGPFFLQQPQGFCRFPDMRGKPSLTPKRKGNQGSFAGKDDGLLSLFEDPDARGERSWRETFGYERRPQKRKGKPFIARGLPRSSSGS
jgi:hypothetical protein